MSKAEDKPAQAADDTVGSEVDEETSSAKRETAPAAESKDRETPKGRSRKEQIAELEAQLAEARDKQLRMRAEFDNYRKRMQREMADVREFARIDTLETMLPVLDHFQMAMAAARQNADIETLQQGMNMILAEFERSFESLGVERLSTVGEAFDPTLHDAFRTEPSETVEEGHVIQEFKGGYRLGKRLLRAASVIVSSGPPEATDAEE